MMNDMNDRAKKMLNNWTPEVSSLIATLKRHKFTIVKGDNGEEAFKLADMSMKKFIENLIACDEAHLYVKGPGSDKTRWLYLVLGNSPGELVSDYSIPNDVADPAVDPMEAVLDEHSKRWEGRKQPQHTAAEAYPHIYGPKAIAEREAAAKRATWAGELGPDGMGR